jgi:hypothetical protein
MMTTKNLVHHSMITASWRRHVSASCEGGRRRAARGSPMTRSGRSFAARSAWRAASRSSTRCSSRPRARHRLGCGDGQRAECGRVARVVKRADFAAVVAGMAVGLVCARRRRGGHRRAALQVRPGDPWPYVLVAIALVGLTSCCVPASRAGNSDPLRVLRNDRKREGRHRWPARARTESAGLNAWRRENQCTMTGDAVTVARDPRQSVSSMA